MQDGPEQVAAIALGSNVGDRRANLAGAVAAIARVPRTTLVATSEMIETEPEGPIVQEKFLNAAVLVRTGLGPMDLLRALHAIERSFGRDRSTNIRFGPRTLDLDLIVHGGSVIAVPELSLPHPRAHERGFVLEPLASIAPDLVIPGRGAVRQLLTDLRIRMNAAVVQTKDHPGDVEPCERA